MRTSSVKAINKPWLILGADKRAIALAFIGASLCAAVNCNKAGYVVFFGFAWAGTVLAKRDPKILEIGASLLRQGRLYDPLKRDQPKRSEKGFLGTE